MGTLREKFKDCSLLERLNHLLGAYKMLTGDKPTLIELGKSEAKQFENMVSGHSSGFEFLQGIFRVVEVVDKEEHLWVR